MGLVERRKTRRRPALSRASWLAVVWVALIGPEPASAQLTVLEGPPELVGSTFEAVNYEFAPQTFDVRGRLLRVERSDWDMSECPPTYVGAGEPAGSVILDVHPLGRCSLRDVSLAVRAVNAVAYLTYSMDIAHHFAPAPGRLQPHYAEAPPQARYGPTVDVTQGDMASFEKATRDPEHGIVVRVRPTPSLWEECFASPWYLVVQVVLTLQACACVELAAMRIEAFCRRAAGPYGRLPRVWLCLELALNLLRAAYYAVDPEGGRGVFSFGVGLLLRSGTFALGSVGTVIFVVHFAQAADSVFHPKTTSARRHNARAAVIAFTVFALLLDLCTSLPFIWQRALVVPALDLFILKAAYTYAVTPITLVCIAYTAAWRVSLALRHLPSTRLRELIARVKATARLTVLLMLYALASPVAAWHPYRSLPLMFVGGTVGHALSYVQILAFHPTGTRVRQGPLRYLALRACALLAPLAHGVHRALGRTRRALVAPMEGAAVALRPWRRDDGQHFDDARELPAVATAAGNDDGDAAGSSRSGPLPPRLLLGVSLAFLQEFVAMYVPDESTPSYDIAPKVVALLGGADVSIAERFQHSATTDGTPVVGRATVFVSHAHACSFARMVDALRLYLEIYKLDPRCTFFWVDRFCMRLPSQAAEVLHIGALEQQIGHVVMVLDPWDAPVCLTRAWCLWEVVHSLQPDALFQITLPESERRRLIEALNTDRARTHEILTSFDVQLAGLPSAVDRDALFTSIVQHYLAYQASRPRGMAKHVLPPKPPVLRVEAGVLPRVAAAADTSLGRGAHVIGGGPRFSVDLGPAVEHFNAMTREAMLCALASFSWHVS